MYKVDIVADSISNHGIRLITYELTYPLLIHQELLTHRVFSRNSASNRAIKTDKMLAHVSSNPFIPEQFPKEQKGMSASEWVEDYESCKETWLKGRDYALQIAKELKDKGVHKQIANRGLFAYLHITTVVSSTDWTNWDALRDSELAQPEIQKLAFLMKEVRKESEPKFLEIGEWHLPYVSAEELKEFGQEAPLLSSGRAGRVSYLNQGYETNPESDIDLCWNTFIPRKHWSATEHAATPLFDKGYCGNFRGWMQLRKLYERYEP